MRKVIFVIVEAALELVPEEISNHPAVISYARKRGKKPSEVLLDRSYHHAAMLKLEKSWKRGRPDITHFTLLEVLGSPLNRSKYVETYVETQSRHIIYINSETRLPRIYERFKGVIEKLYREPIVESSGKILLKLEEGGIRDIVSRVKPDVKILLSEKGLQMKWSELGEKIIGYDYPMLMLGGFPRGEFEDETKMNADLEVSIWDQPLESWIVASRIFTILEYLVLGMS
ncbi:MAG: 16S rRNA methyltransferase [Aigarchaeota archaeon]|nr:16S rRNA methyltransferase [Aigarchaeota archaeon]MCX8192311.1 16S rRNA methyltransferase [Nitrososphaeria archaeon]MDW7986835.1 16S rRNA methyltransferase [Nitrososphaerota archaeon]